ncbi:MAG: hypothetical protein ONB48_11870 [candidate division KSB1 bacterium]|nr:hypothetical protein [candidate division KSB1 bacterium]MDZ7273968.1 hypothetical protein [candidate division KSB1 bacterium]MDZ7286341.1 hypothetical protein [candidate division KSB1 bacterium]MDZ7296569.1 hypothetical protein [candidate division KSB1 bacterium]MDZ7306102.1 hypothetical protein [candidate division KSB1 bacterium]
MTVRIVIATKKPVSPAVRIGLVLMVLLLAGLVLLVAGAILLPLLGVAVALSVGMLAWIFILALAGALALIWRRAMLRIFFNFARSKHPQPLAQLQPDNLLQLPASATARQRQDNSNQSGPEGKPEV